MAGETLLIVDDQPANLKLLASVLELHDYEIQTATSAEHALAILAGLRPQLIVMDLKMPGMSGLELAARLKADPSTREIAILAATASAMKGDAEKARAAGCDAYMTKPIDIDLLASTVSRLVRAP